MSPASVACRCGRAEDWFCRSFDLIARIAGEVEEGNDITALLQPWAGCIERILRADGPETSERLLVEPHHSLVQATRIEISVGGFAYVHLRAKETWAAAGFGEEAKSREIAHWQGIDLPTFWLFAVERDAAGETFRSE